MCVCMAARKLYEWEYTHPVYLHLLWFLMIFPKINLNTAVKYLSAQKIFDFMLNFVYWNSIELPTKWFKQELPLINYY